MLFQFWSDFKISGRATPAAGAIAGAEIFHRFYLEED